MFRQLISRSGIQSLLDPLHFTVLQPVIDYLFSTLISIIQIIQSFHLLCIFSPFPHLSKTICLSSLTVLLCNEKAFGNCINWRSTRVSSVEAPCWNRSSEICSVLLPWLPSPTSCADRNLYLKNQVCARSLQIVQPNVTRCVHL